MNRAVSFIEPIVVMAFGAYLGLVNQASSGTSGWLRVPAMLAAFILVAQGIMRFQQIRGGDESHRSDNSDIEVAEVIEWNPPTAELEAPGRARHRDVPVTVKVSGGGTAEIDDSPPDEKPVAIYLIMALAVWLGLASLANPGAPRSLLVMSLLAAFLLFAEAWQMLRRTME